jgi:hypothetical protein
MYCVNVRPLKNVDLLRYQRADGRRTAESVLLVMSDPPSVAAATYGVASG